MSDLHINTTQNVKLLFTTASIGDRILAYGADLLIKAAYSIAVFFLFFAMYDVKRMSGGDHWTFIAVIFLFSLPVVFYTLASETFMEGQTLGKKLLKIKVVKIDGYQAGFFDYLIRWIFILVDIQMGFVPGLITMLVTKHTQRLGDMAAGTAVITEKSKYNISHTILMDVEEQYEPHFTQNQVMLFSDNDIRIIKENSEMAFRQGDYEIIDRIARKIEAVMGSFTSLKNNRELIETLLKDYNYYTGK